MGRLIAVTKDGIYYRHVVHGSTDGHQLMFYSFKTRRKGIVKKLPFIQSFSTFAVSSDGRYYLLSKSELQNNVMLVEDFH